MANDSMPTPFKAAFSQSVFCICTPLASCRIKSFRPVSLHRKGGAYVRGSIISNLLWRISSSSCTLATILSILSRAPRRRDPFSRRWRTSSPGLWDRSTGSPYCNFYFRFPFAPKHAFASAGEFVDCFRDLLLLFCTEKYTEDLLSHFPRNAPVHFTHGDLLPKNVVVSGSTVTGLVDWATAGFYPSYWEYCMMHQQPYRTPGWDYVLRKVFPSERRTQEIWAVNRLVDVLEATF